MLLRGANLWHFPSPNTSYQPPPGTQQGWRQGAGSLLYHQPVSARAMSAAPKETSIYLHSPLALAGTHLVLFFFFSQNTSRGVRNSLIPSTSPIHSRALLRGKHAKLTHPSSVLAHTPPHHTAARYSDLASCGSANFILPTDFNPWAIRSAPAPALLKTLA